MSLWKSKPTIIEAFRWTGDVDQTEDPVWIVEAIKRGDVSFGSFGGDGVEMKFKTLHGDYAYAKSGDWVAKEPMEGRFYPIKDEVFRAKYEPAP